MGHGPCFVGGWGLEPSGRLPRIGGRVSALGPRLTRPLACLSHQDIKHTCAYSTCTARCTAACTAACTACTACRYGWKWDSSYQEVKYTFTTLDKTTISNIAARSPRLWAHAVLTWAVSFVVYWILWRCVRGVLRCSTCLFVCL